MFSIKIGKFIKRGTLYIGRNAFEWLLFNGFSIRTVSAFLSRPVGASVLLYHRVCDRQNYPFLVNSEISSIAPHRFERHLRWMKDSGYTFFTVGALSEIISAGQSPPERSVVITFDDIFRDNVEIALDILTKMDVPATFFVITDNINSHRLLWQHRLYWYLEEKGRQHFCDAMRRIDADAFDGLNDEDVVAKFKKCVSPARKEELFEQYGEPIPYEFELARNIYITAEDVRKLRSAGREVGSHSCGHYFMEMLSDEDYLKELVESKGKLEGILGEHIRSFSYPHNSYRPDEELVSRSGYQAICTVDGYRVDKDIPLHKLPRFNMQNRRLSLPALRRRLLT